jgi:hypothetical protein
LDGSGEIVDSSVVNKGIRQAIRPVLKEAGFNEFAPRTAWRRGPGQIDVVNFQSFNSYNAGVIGCTTYSFSVNLGCFLLEVPPGYPSVETRNGAERPEEYRCHLRGRLHRTILQPELARRDIWYIDPEGAYLAAALEDVRRALLRDAAPWFELLHNRTEVLRILEQSQESMEHLWGFGAPGSPIRNYLIGYVALRLGQVEVARKALLGAAATPSYANISERLKDDAQRAV